MKLKKLKNALIIRKSIWIVCLWTFSISGLFVLLGFAGKQKSSVKCTGVNILISEENGNEFISENDVLELLNSNGKQPVGKYMDDINIAMLEKLVNSNPFVANAEVFSTIDGKLEINILQRNPIVRIINNNDEQFYIDDRGEFMPVSQNCAAPVIVANGFIHETYGKKSIGMFNADEADTLGAKPLINQLYELVQFITKDPFWDAQIEQVYVNEQSEIELIPRIGNHRIILGDAVQLEEKFNKLMIFYNQGLSKTGWNSYSVINLKFRNQVICTKTISEKNKTSNKTSNKTN